MNKNKAKNHPSNKEERYLNRLREEIFGFFDVNHDQAFSIQSLHRYFGVKDPKAKTLFDSLLRDLLRDNRVVKLPDNTYQLDNELAFVIGKVDHVNPRFAFVVAEEAQGNDIYIETRDLNGAVDGDIVKVTVWKAQGANRRPEGEVLEVIERRRTEVVGTLERFPKFAIVTPDSRRLYEEIVVALHDVSTAQSGDKVIVQISKWGQNGTRSEGKVIEVLGKAGQNDTEMHAILAEFGLPNRFPEAVEQEAAQISEHITEDEIAKRRDFRSIRTFTIDPEDAKDFDDALSISYLDNGNYEIGVHIADVTHYVLPDTELETEAYRRATSVYLVDRTVPMLPEKLSNKLCSLRPHEDKLTFSAVFELSPNATVLKQWFGRTVIHSARRFTYEQAQELLEISNEQQATLDAHEQSWAQDLQLFNRLAKQLRQERFNKGAINFETVEVKFKLDEKGEPVSIYQKIRKDAHKLIEEFMLLANKKVAEYVFSLSKGEDPLTMVYRIHEPPNYEKLQQFANFANRFGHQMRLSESNVSTALNALMERIEGTPEQNTLESLAVRAMSKARYTTQPIGHFGLAFAHYSHFTSPIRRYPDMMAHRLLQHYLLKGKPADRETYERACRVSSEREKLASEAERASIKYKQVEFMSKMPPHQTYEGIVTGVTEFGVFVEITETACEGLVRMSELQDDFYEYDKENFRIVGRRSGRIITFGDAVQVKVKETNMARRSMDLVLVALKSGDVVRKVSEGRKVPAGRRQGPPSSGRKNTNNRPPRRR